MLKQEFILCVEISQIVFTFIHRPYIYSAGNVRSLFDNGKGRVNERERESEREREKKKERKRERENYSIKK